MTMLMMMLTMLMKVKTATKQCCPYSDTRVQDDFTSLRHRGNGDDDDDNVDDEEDDDKVVRRLGKYSSKPILGHQDDFTLLSSDILRRW